MRERDYKPTSQTIIGREFMGSTHCEYDPLLKAARMKEPQIPHNFYKCFAKKREKAEQYLKDHKHDAYSNPARNVIEEQK